MGFTNMCTYCVRYTYKKKKMRVLLFLYLRTYQAITKIIIFIINLIIQYARFTVKL